MCFLACFFPCFSYIAAEGDSVSQVLVPREVYVGDSAEIRYTFHAPSSFPAGGGKPRQLQFEKSPLSSIDDICSVRNLVLSGSGSQYTLTVTVIPWRIGTVDFPPFDLMTLMDSRLSGFVVDLKPFSVGSIAEKTGSSVLRPPSPPVLIPGTTYIIYGAAVLILLFLGICIRALLNVRAIIDFWRGVVRRAGYGRNARIALRDLHRLQRKEKTLDDGTFCAQLQAVTRVYLEYRFSFPFHSVTSDRFEPVFENITGGTLSLSQSLRIEELGALFRRTDYIRYASGSLDAARLPASRYAAVLAGNERSMLIETVRTAVHFFECDTEDDACPERTRDA